MLLHMIYFLGTLLFKKTYMKLNRVYPTGENFVMNSYRLSYKKKTSETIHFSAQLDIVW